MPTRDELFAVLTEFYYGGVGDRRDYTYKTVDAVLALLAGSKCICTHGTCRGVPGDVSPEESGVCRACIILDPEAPCLADEGGEA